jgi:uncharacterized iron-regulated protein
MRAAEALATLGATIALSACAAHAPPATPAPPASAKRENHWESRLDVDHPLAGVVWDVAGRRRVDPRELTGRVQSATIVLVGEAHDNPDHHRLEARLLEAFAARHGAPAVVFEMLDRERQPAVDASLSAHPRDADALGKAVAWESSGWPAWSMYRPIFEAAIAARSAILAAGLDRNSAMRIAHEGVAAFDPGLDLAFGLHVPPSPEVQAAVREEMGEAHCGLMPDARLDPMVLVQRTRDALLAERLHAGTSGGRGALLIAGAGHVRRDRGVPEQLMHAYGATSLAIGLIEVKSGVTTPDGYAEPFHVRDLPFDYVWFTPRATDVDHCAELREHMKAHG